MFLVVHYPRSGDTLTGKATTKPWAHSLGSVPCGCHLQRLKLVPQLPFHQRSCSKGGRTVI